MNRCPTPPSQPPQAHAGRRHFSRYAMASLATLVLLVGTGIGTMSRNAWAQDAVRAFPPRTERGTMVVTQPLELLMDGRAERLSPGSRIRGTNNLLVLSGTLVGQNLLVNYLREPNGLIHEVWILTPAEAAKPLPAQP